MAGAGEDANVYVASAAEIVALIQRDLTTSEASALDAGALLVTEPAWAASDHALITAPAAEPVGAARQHRVPVVHLRATSPYTHTPNAFVSAAALERLSAVEQPVGAQLFTPAPDGVPPDEAAEARMEAAMANAIGSEFYSLSVERGSQAVQEIRALLVATLAVSLVTGIGVATVMIGLIMTDQAAQLAVLRLIGASRRQVALFAGVQALVIACIGAGCAVALVAIAAVSWFLGPGAPLSATWVWVTLLAALGTLIAGGTTGLGYGWFRRLDLVPPAGPHRCASPSWPSSGVGCGIGRERVGRARRVGR